MSSTNRWGFCCEKQSASASQAMIVSNHPLASAAGAEVLLAGGNAIDATVAALFALTVVEPMMIGVLGGGVTQLRLNDGRHRIVDGLSTAPQAANMRTFEPLSDELANYRDTLGRANLIGPRAVAVPGALAAWCETLREYGSWPLADVVAPAIRLAERGFNATPYLVDCVKDMATDLACDSALAARFLPGGAPLPVGSKVVQTDYAETLRSIAKGGASVLYDGELGAALVGTLASRGGLIEAGDLRAYRPLWREPIRGDYRGYEIFGPPPPASAGVHIVQMFNVLEGFDIAAMGFGSDQATHLLVEVLKIAFTDRAVATADPDFVNVPIQQLISKDYARERRALIDLNRALHWQTGITLGDSKSTTHVSCADALGNVVASTQTINGLFGACVEVPGTGMLTNNYMYNFDPHPGNALSIEPGKRVFTSMAPMMVCQNEQIRYTLGLPGGLRIFPSAFQALVNLLDHRMPLQEALEAPRLWTEGGVVELEEAYADSQAPALEKRGHTIERSARIGGGMNAISFSADGLKTGAACWRADGTPVGIAGGLARAGVRFSGL